MSNIENMKKSLDNVEKTLLTKAVADDAAKKELKENIVKQLDTLILKTEVEMLEKHLTTGMFTKPITEPAKAIAKPAIGLGKKIGRSVARYGKGVGTAAKIGAATWKDPTPKPVIPSVAKPIKTSAPKQTNLKVTTSSKAPAAVGAISKPVAKPKQTQAIPTPAKTIKESEKSATIDTGTGEDTAKQLAATRKKRSAESAVL